MNEFSTKMVQDYFQKYYNTVNSFGIRELDKRELAFSFFGKGGMIRHTSFPNPAELRNFVVTNAPQHFYYSSAYYQDPSANMENKKWMGADLVFDIDGDHIEGADKMSYSQMLNLVKEELKKLIVILKDDLNVKDRDMEIVFSGSRGYHVHVYSLFETTESQERREIVDYITGKCISPEYRLTNRAKWETRINDIRNSLINIAKKGGKRWKEKLARETGEITEIPDKKDVKLNKYIDTSARKLAVNRFSSKIDEPVTIDIHRLIRTPGSLHGKSALMVKTIAAEDIENFDPLTESIPSLFVEKVEVRITRKITMEFLDEKTDLEEGKSRVPVYSALYAVLKGSAEFFE